MQAKLNQTLQAHYQHRGSTGKEAIRSVKMTMSATIDTVSAIDTELERILQEMKVHLERHNKEQAEIIKQGQESESQHSEELSDMKISTNSKDKSVSFAIPLECS